MFKDLVSKRYSCRKFTNQKVDNELIEEIIEIAMKAPTAVNKQPYKIFWMQSAEAKENLSKVNKYMFGAENFLVVGCKRSDAWTRVFDGKNFAEVDGSIVGTHLMLAIYDAGLATTWVGHFDEARLKEMYPSMKDYELIALFPIGYAAEEGKPSKQHYDRKTKDEVLEIL